jgi:hypothetical protein
MGINLNSKNARTEYEFLNIEADNQKFAVVKVNMNKSKQGTDIAKFFCQIVEGEHKDKIVTHELAWTEKNEYKLREFAIKCGFPTEQKRDDRGEYYDHISIEYPADYVGGMFIADAKNVSKDNVFLVLKNLEKVK